VWQHLCEFFGQPASISQSFLGYFSTGIFQNSGHSPGLLSPGTASRHKDPHVTGQHFFVDSSQWLSFSQDLLPRQGSDGMLGQVPLRTTSGPYVIIFIFLVLGLLKFWILNPAFAIITAQERMTKTRILPLFGPNFKSVQSFLDLKLHPCSAGWRLLATENFVKKASRKKS